MRYPAERVPTAQVIADPVSADGIAFGSTVTLVAQPRERSTGPLSLKASPAACRTQKEPVLGVAFTKEESFETASETVLPDRPISPHLNLVTAAGLTALRSQLDTAREAYEAAQKVEDAE